MDCQICGDYFPEIPLLRCGHAICAKDYCNQKSNGYNSCCICNKKMIRGARKNIPKSLKK